MNNTLKIAQWLANQGMHVFPLRPSSKRPLRNCPDCTGNGCGQPQQCPCLEADRPCHGLLAATTNPDRISQWFERIPQANVGIHAGRSGLVVLDLDTKNTPAAPAAPDTVADGLGAFTALCTHAGVEWPETLTVATPSGGRHLYFRCPDELVVASDATGRVGHQIDIRADGGYILAPGSSIITPPEEVFGSYQRISTAVDIAPLPQWLHERVSPPTPSIAPVMTPNWRAFRPGSHTAGYWRHIWHAELNKVETRDGERWRLVYAAARRLANLATHDTAPWNETDATNALVTAAIRRRQHTGKPLQPATAERNAQRGWQRGTTDTPESLHGLGHTA